MELPHSNDTNKKVNLENLSKEELIKKCTQLLQLAQKAKQSKTVLQEENSKLKEELNIKKSDNSDPVTQELIENLTIQKLNLVTTIQELKSQNEGFVEKYQTLQSEIKEYQEKLTISDNENTSYKRQIKRLTDENEQLITDLDTLEQQLVELKSKKANQQQRILKLEQIKSEETKNATVELQNMLSISLGEVKKLQTENDQLKDKISNLEFNLKEKDKNIVIITEELLSAKNTDESETDKIGANLDEKYNKIRELEESSVKLKQKIKFYHSKIVKFANIAKELRTSKNEILELFKSYIEQVKVWKDQLNFGEKNIVKYLNGIEQENQNLKDKLDQLNQLEKASDLEKHTFESDIRQYLGKLEMQTKEIVDLKEDRDKIVNELKSKHEEELLHWKKEVLDFKKTIEKHETEINILKDQYESEKLDLQKQFFESKEKYEAEKLHWEKELLDSKEIYENEIKMVKDQYENEKMHKENELLEVDSNKLLKLEHEMEEIRVICEDQKCSLNELTNSKQDLELRLTETKQIVNERENEIQLLRKENVTISKIKEDLIHELEKLNCDKRSLKEKSENLKKDFEKRISDLHNEVRSLQELESSFSDEIKNLSGQNKSLLSQNEMLQDRLQKFEYSLQNRTNVSSQTNEVACNTEEFEEQVSNLKRENAELLSEMNEMNQAIKERGENISKLEAHCEEVMKKLQIYESQANKNIANLTEKERIIEDLTREINELKNRDIENSSYTDEIDALKGEVEMLKDKLNSNLESNFTDDGMSTSTISRTEEINRLKDLEGSWEERYGKLRNLAVKLKSKVRELTQALSNQKSENEEIQTKLSSSIKTIQNLQSQYDKLEDDLEKSKKECANLQSQLSGAACDISRDKQYLANSEEIIAELKIELENKRKEKEATENWKKQVGAKIQTLRKELEANNVLKKDFEAKISTLNSNLEAKELALKSEIENHKHTKSLLDQSNNERKKNSVLSLEMQDYERGAKESSKKLEKQQEEITQLKNQVDSQKSTINALRAQNKLLEEKIISEEDNVNTLTSEISTYKKQISNLDNEISQKIDKIQSLTQQLETSRSEAEELSTELSKLISEHQKANNILKSERDHLSADNLRLQQSLREVQDSLRLNKDELKVVQDEYNGYKVRAQSVLRQNQNRDVGVEEKLSEEVASLLSQNLALTDQIQDAKKTIESLKSTNSKLSTEIRQYEQKVRELEEDREEIKIQFAALSAKHEKTIIENAETLRNLKVHADTLSQCYRQQLADQETRHNRDIVELQSRLDKAPTPTETSPIVPTMPRGEGEGSESIGSNNSFGVHPVPLERLLGTDSEQEIERIKKKLQDNESKVIHLTSLLSDTEQDLVKHVQMNKLLKEEIRRQQRSEEREKHAENLEYLKNVVFKFVTLNSGDERSRLVPVLNTILKLSPEETKHLNYVATGGANSLKGWSSYLPAWSSPNKPQ